MKSKGRLVAAISGGVDSSVAAAICLEEGYEVIGVTLKLKDCDDSRERRKACCGADDFIHARLAAAKLGIPHYFLDLKENFARDVLTYAWNEYRIGRTPNPCVMCNFHLKFGALAEYAAGLGAEGLITGHYAELERCTGGQVHLRHAADDEKDQVYFLAMLTRRQLSFCRFPLGSLTKPQVREKAASLGLSNAWKAESQDACFGYKGENFSRTLAEYFDAEMPAGEVVTEDGKVVGHHDGIHNYTIGQRKGLGIALGSPAYVKAIDAEHNRIILTTDTDHLKAVCLETGKPNWLMDMPEEFDCEAQIRYNQTPVPAHVTKQGGDKTIVTFKSPVSAPAPGQLAAFYDDRLVLGSAFIEKVIK